MDQPDLNALYVIEALALERSVSRAADRLGLTQPAVSHALARLRESFQDDLFVRAGAVMAPTPVGEKVIDGVQRALAVIRQDIWQAKSFDAATTTRTFSVCLSDMGVIVLLPRLLAALHAQAPNATLRPIQVPSVELASALQDGEVDLAIGYLGRLGENLHQQSLFRRSLVGIIAGSGTRKTVKMSLERFVASRHVVSATLAITNQLLEKELRRQGMKLRIGVDVPYLLAVPGLVANSDYIAVVPEELAALFSRLAAVDVFTLPIPLEDLTVQQFWHARYHNDAGHRWFRALVASTLRQ
ncbi:MULTISPECIES: LysR family transcriptional regulator [Paraburkholderia]|jgi:DNA-binding transcriptional LysR family regulator|uniref:LysR family transcriptional regulator n=2 Tax=Paraburkholderia TaxID=1822464 RepID=A0AAJ4VTU6_9BURK|nr:MULTISPECIES: LysR family transcriptional regulator [Paraburkholderia]SKC76513.1 DNA-binding transcriptional regulator, LysR family [Burkholderia sp. CF099]AUT61703.1 LysR family transcriptional regulator [Paraburkholderia terrae]AUT68292.1 LysR family transcriptional regulator [Paraburkholderia hospita]AXE98431.1 LysR family transcriptional regulator [Paraburkholderia hospita]OUL70583.1 LysR family transcriptional regulator [Paraburkholderia hospita]